MDKKQSIMPQRFFFVKIYISDRIDPCYQEGATTTSVALYNGAFGIGGNPVRADQLEGCP
jgi:hypothetical protein